KFPVIIGLHGHRETNVIFRDNYFGIDFVARGFLVIIPTFRAMNIDKEEDAVTRKLCLNGFTLMGLRVYETLLVIKYLKYLD
ncbi:unnamed protein product, partial [marine sediment metagenome]